MRIVAHPILLAVALGLLGPAALECEEEEGEHTDVSGPALDGDGMPGTASALPG